MSKDLWIGALIGGMVGSAMGGWMHKSKSDFDADLVTYQNMAPTPAPTTPLPTPTPKMPEGWCLCPTPTQTPVPATAKEIAERKAWYEIETQEIKAHANDFVPMPNPKATYQGVTVEFFEQGPSTWVSDRIDQKEPPENGKNDKIEETRYHKFYGIEDDKDKTMINGFKRGAIFGWWLNDGEFDSLHKPFYGMKAFYKFCAAPDCGSRPSPRWVYCVWSVRYKAPIPFAYPSEAIHLVKRQQEIKKK